MNSYILLTPDGYTFSPNSDGAEPDVENLQVLGFSEGVDEKDAFWNFLAENPHLGEKGFDEVICIEIKGKMESALRFYISENRDEN
jgi:hypothetical protein